MFQTAIFAPLVMGLLLPYCTPAEMVHVVTPESLTTEVTDTTVLPEPEDSYISALRDSQSGVLRREEAVYERPHHEDDYNTLSLSSDVSDSSYPTLTHQPPPSYGPTNPTVYVPVAYGPASPIPHHTPAPSYGMPFANPESLLPMLPKINLPTLFKILLKMVLFKMVVKFIAIICLLFFIPTLTPKSDDSEERQSQELSMLSDLVWSSIYRSNDTDPDTTHEEIQDVVNRVDDKMSGPSTESALGFLEFCVSATNAVVGFMMSVLQYQRGETDPLWQYVWDKLKWFLRRL